MQTTKEELYRRYIVDGNYENISLYLRLVYTLFKRMNTLKVNLMTWEYKYIFLHLYYIILFFSISYYADYYANKQEENQFKVKPNDRNLFFSVFDG